LNGLKKVPPLPEAILPAHQLFIYLYIFYIYMYTIYQHFGLVVRVWRFWARRGVLGSPPHSSKNEAEKERRINSRFETIQKRRLKWDGGPLYHHLIKNKL